MTRVLYVTSAETFSGKSALCVCLAKRFQRDGLRIGYMKPVSCGDRLGTGQADEDADLFRLEFGLTDSLEDMAPIRLAENTVTSVLEGADLHPGDLLQVAFRRVASDRDVVLLEGGCNLREGLLVGLPPLEVSSMLGAQVLLTVKYDKDLHVLEDALSARELFGAALIGIVLNQVPRQHMPVAQELLKPALEKRDIPVMAVLPQERLLLSISVAELVELLEAEVLCGSDKQDELVEHLMVGAMGVESALTYFRRRPNKAVITGGDRPDIQLAALETSTKCLILTGSLRPSLIILRRAEEVGVPMLLVRQDTMTTVETIERVFGKTRFQQEKKIQRFSGMLEDRFDFGLLYQELGLQ